MSSTYEVIRHTKEDFFKKSSSFALRLRSRGGEGNGGVRGKAGGGLCRPLSVPPYYEDSIVNRNN